VQTVQRCAEEIEDEEDARPATKRTVDGKAGPREKMLVEIVAPFDAELENEKGDAEYPGCGAALDEPAAIPGLDEGDTALYTKLLTTRITVLIVPIASSVCWAPASNPAWFQWRE
jgi:hypothetical protein